MARKMMSALALVVLFSTAACNNSMGPAADSDHGTSIDRPSPRPADQISSGDEVIDPGEGNGGGDQLGEPLRAQRLQHRRHRGDVIEPGEGNGGGDVVPIGDPTSNRDRRRSHGQVTPH